MSLIRAQSATNVAFAPIALTTQPTMIANMAIAYVALNVLTQGQQHMMYIFAQAINVGRKKMRGK